MASPRHEAQKTTEGWPRSQPEARQEGRADDNCMQVAERLDHIMALLIREYGRHAWRPRRDPLSELIRTILSQNTSDKNSGPAFEQLRTRFRTWEEVLNAPTRALADTIRSAGLSNVKAPRIKAVLAEIQERRSSLDLYFLDQMDLEEAKAWLRSLPGVGPKTAACVLMFGLGKPALPVDTHVYRVSRRLGLIDRRISVERAHEVLERLIQPGQVYDFHLNLVTHGRRVCLAQRPRCSACILQQDCCYYQQQFK